MERFLPSLLTIGLGLGLGFLVGSLFRRYSSNAEGLPYWRLQIQKLCILVLNPAIFIGAVWVLPTSDSRLAWLPIVGLVGLSSGFLVGWLAMRLRPLPAPGQRIGFSLACSMTNVGNIGGLIVFLLLGEIAYSLVPFYKLLEEFWYYGVLFPYARQQAINHGLIQDTGIRQHHLLRLIRDPFFLASILSIGLGLALNLIGIERPAMYGAINAWLIPTSSFLFLVAVGTQIRIGRIPRFWKPALAITLLRVGFIPLFVLAFALLVGFGDTPLVIKTALVLAMMPMGFISFVPAALYNLDADLISSAWIFTTGNLVFTVALLSFLFA